VVKENLMEIPVVIIPNHAPYQFKKSRKINQLCFTALAGRRWSRPAKIGMPRHLMIGAIPCLQQNPQFDGAHGLNVR
jgi:hypothetical protein